jgi:hypothetical protein
MVQDMEDTMTSIYTSSADAEIPAAVTGDARTAAVKSIVDKKIANYKKHLRVTTNTQYSFYTWDPDYKKTPEEEEEWTKM